jgi:hypothetical protein
MKDQSLESQRCVDYYASKKSPAQALFAAAAGVGTAVGLAQQAPPFSQLESGLNVQSNTGYGVGLQTTSSGTSRAIEKVVGVPHYCSIVCSLERLAETHCFEVVGSSS